MKNKKGFSLVELLAVIVVLGIILSITTVSILNLKEKQDEENIKNTISSILTAAKEYNVEHRFGVGHSNGVEVSTLKNNGYVDFDEESKYKGNKIYKDLLMKDDTYKVYKETCANPGAEMKIKYVFSKSIETSEGTKRYNDCGCMLNDEQNGSKSEKLCEE